MGGRRHSCIDLHSSAYICMFAFLAPLTLPLRARPAQPWPRQHRPLAGSMGATQPELSPGLGADSERLCKGLLKSTSYQRVPLGTYLLV